ncbi:MAG: ThuA domain-containing protein [Prolixibacteraceae bacterium]
MKRSQFILLLLLVLSSGCFAKSPKQAVNVLVLTERGGQHKGFVVEALKWLNEFCVENSFKYTEVNHATEIDAAMLKKYNVFLQLNYPPYTWSKEAEDAFIKSIEKGKIGWVGFHHASLLGEFDGYPMWNWFSDFMGGIRFKNYIAATASASVIVEDKDHPVMKGVNASFVLPDDEWYTFDKSPRPNVHVLASADEASYQPKSEIKMGDHPAIWTNEKMKARNVYFLMGHANTLFDSSDFKKMFKNALLWVAEK